MDQGRTDVTSFGSTLWAGIAGRCPSCHRGKLFSGYLALALKCNVCGLDYSFADSGDGPAVFVILVTGFLVTGAALITEILIGSTLSCGDLSPSSCRSSCYGPSRAC